MRVIGATLAVAIFALPAQAADNFPFRDGLGSMRNRASKDIGAGVYADQTVPSDQFGAPYNASNPLRVNAQLAATTTNSSGAVVTGGTFQQVFPVNAARKGCLIVNPVTATEPLYVNFVASGVTPILSNSVPLSAGQSASCVIGNAVLGDEVRVTAATNGHTFVALQQ